ncbi:MAG TPA: glycosyltransferase family 39 protein [Anaeromyxobacter sp.]
MLDDVLERSAGAVDAARKGPQIAPPPRAAAAVALPAAAPRSLAMAQFLPGPVSALGLVVLASLLCRLGWLNVPDRALIFDEAYYVNAARTMLGWPVPPAAPYAAEPPGRDPNREHPPLGKLAIATSMRWLGDTPLGWRLPSLVAGVASILLVFLIVLAARGDPWLGVVAATLFAFDNLAFVHSRIGTLDMPLVACLLLAAWLALRDRPLLAGMACALAALIKITGVHGSLALVLLLAVRGSWSWRDTGRWPAASVRAIAFLLVGFVGLWTAGLWLLDLNVGAYRTPWEHLRFMLHYGFSLVNVQGPQGQESHPWQWLLNEVQMTYLRTEQRVLVNGAVTAVRPVIDFRGAMNPLIIGAAPLGVGYAIWRVWTRRDVLALWVVTWIAATHLPFYPLAMLQHRVSYIFYFLPTLPAVAVALASVSRQAGLPRIALWTYLALVLVGFIGYFPFRAVM